MPLEAAGQRRGGAGRVIPYDYITEWRDRAPWVQDVQVEQDLIIARAIVEVFGHPDLRNSLAFRGGTALYKLHLPPVRYSEDIDLMQVEPAPIGPTLDALRSVLDPWLGEPTRKRSTGTVTLSSLNQSVDRLSKVTSRQKPNVRLMTMSESGQLAIT